MCVPISLISKFSKRLRGGKKGQRENKMINIIYFKMRFAFFLNRMIVSFRKWANIL